MTAGQKFGALVITDAFLRGEITRLLAGVPTREHLGYLKHARTTILPAFLSARVATRTPSCAGKETLLFLVKFVIWMATADRADILRRPSFVLSAGIMKRYVLVQACPHAKRASHLREQPPFGALRKSPAQDTSVRSRPSQLHRDGDEGARTKLGVWMLLARKHKLPADTATAP